MSNLITFNFNSAPIRVETIDGDPWFVANDVCDALGYKNARKALTDNCRADGVTSGYVADAAGRMQPTNLISEGNVYRLIVKCRLPLAESFERKVCDEILPTIRKTGSYSTPAAQQVMAVSNDTLMAMLTQTLAAVGGKTVAIEASVGNLETKQAAQAIEVARIADELADRDLHMRHVYRGEVENIKTQVFRAMAARGVGASKIAHDFWSEVKARASVSTVKVECLTVGMAKRLLKESVRQARIWNIPVVINLPLEAEADAG